MAHADSKKQVMLPQIQEESGLLLVHTGFASVTHVSTGGDRGDSNEWILSEVGCRPVEGRAQEIITSKGMGPLVIKMVDLVNSQLKPGKFRGGSVIYVESIENPDDWEIVVVTKLNITREERFALSICIGEDLNHLLSSEHDDPNWTHVTFRIDLA